MGKHSRAHKEQLLRNQQKSKRIRNGIIATGLAVGAFVGIAEVRGGDQAPLSPEVTSAHQNFLNRYECKFAGKIALSVEDFDQTDSLYGSDGQRQAYTKGNRIAFHSSMTNQEATDIVPHELVHACVDEKPRMFARGYLTEPGLYATGAAGFKVWFSDSTPAKPNEFTGIEEGVAEWLAGDVPGYTLSDSEGYIATRQLTQTLATKAGLSRDAMFELHQDSDLLGYISAVHHEPREQVTDQQITDFIFLYQGAITTGYTPSEQELGDVYGIA